MDFTTIKNKDEYIIIIGYGRLGANLVSALSDTGRKNILVIDKNNDTFRKLPATFAGNTLTGDARNVSVLSEAQIQKATSVILLTGNDYTNIIAALIVKKVFSVRQVIARLCDTRQECIYDELDIDTLCPEIHGMRTFEQVFGIFQEGDDDYEIIYKQK